jgi:hypothetical protein
MATTPTATEKRKSDYVKIYGSSKKLDIDSGLPLVKFVITNDIKKIKINGELIAQEYECIQNGISYLQRREVPNGYIEEIHITDCPRNEKGGICDSEKLPLLSDDKSIKTCCKKLVPIPILGIVMNRPNTPMSSSLISPRSTSSSSSASSSTYDSTNTRYENQAWISLFGGYMIVEAIRKKLTVDIHYAEHWEIESIKRFKLIDISSEIVRNEFVVALKRALNMLVKSASTRMIICQKNKKYVDGVDAELVGSGIMFSGYESETEPDHMSASSASSTKPINIAKSSDGVAGVKRRFNEVT